MNPYVENGETVTIMATKFISRVLRALMPDNKHIDNYFDRLLCDSIKQRR